MKKLLLLAVLFTLGVRVSYAQESTDTTQSTLAKLIGEIDLLKRIKVSGYLQGQFQYADSSGQRSFNGGDFASGVDKRFSVRRGRLKVQYDSPVNAKGFSTSQYVFQFDVTERGAVIKDAYVKITDPWSGWVSLTTGIQNRPFGYEIGYSSSMRESPERGRMSQIIFPNERDLGAMVTIQGPKTSRWNWIKLEAGMFNGTGAPSAGASINDFDKFKDFIGHLSFSKSTPSETIKYGAGFSYYMGGFRHDAANSYKYGTDSNGVKGFVIDVKKADVNPVANFRKAIERTYMGVDAQFSIDWVLGLTTIRGEYIWGIQPGTSSTSTSPNAPFTSSVPVTSIFRDTSGNVVTMVTGTTTSPTDLYSRNFNGAYFYFLQNILQTPLQLILKYDWYDPDTDVAGDEIGRAVTKEAKITNATDIKYETIGVGLAYRWDANLKITAYYDMVKNETSTNLAGFQADLPDDVFTLRLQLKF